MSDSTRIAFAERQGWKQLERCTKTLEDWPVVLATEKKIWYLNGYGQCAYWMPNDKNHSDVNTALMEMSEEEWESFIIYLHKRIGFCVSAHAVMEATLKTPLSTLVECYLAATEGRLNKTE